MGIPRRVPTRSSPNHATRTPPVFDTAVRRSTQAARKPTSTPKPGAARPQRVHTYAPSRPRTVRLRPQAPSPAWRSSRAVPAKPPRSVQFVVIVFPPPPPEGREVGIVEGRVRGGDGDREGGAFFGVVGVQGGGVVLGGGRVRVGDASSREALIFSAIWAICRPWRLRCFCPSCRPPASLPAGLQDEAQDSNQSKSLSGTRLRHHPTETLDSSLDAYRAQPKTAVKTEIRLEARKRLPQATQA
ncbi:hypothetical protein B0H16DRAFT_1880896 [Mycena metata]|uniref:Uncharacterized protein n=1 Tax=Mycena metata TaxID=1033252 RepID=A0AAD7NRR8_9AGAR|nr:hypothetical protein B0H16DRAFT_1880896 [Mycena metata]